MTEPPVRFELRDGVAHVTLSHPMPGTLDLHTVRELRRALKRAESESATGVLLASTRSGSAGVETDALADQEAAIYIADLARLFARYP
jgi:enoyl-CoA hydratase/carnithine racemase